MQMWSKLYKYVIILSVPLFLGLCLTFITCSMTFCLLRNKNISDIKGEEELREFHVGTGSALPVHRKYIRFMYGLWPVVSSWAYCIIGSCYQGRLPTYILLHTSTLQSVPPSGWNAPGRRVMGLCTEAHTGLRHPSLWPAANQWANSHYCTQVSAVCWDIWYGDRGLVSS